MAIGIIGRRQCELDTTSQSVGRDVTLVNLVTLQSTVEQSGQDKTHIL